MKCQTNLPSNYTILVDRIPKHLGNEENKLRKEMKTFFENNALMGKPVKVKKIILFYNYSDYYKLEGEREKIMRRYQKLLVE